MIVFADLVAPPWHPASPVFWVALVLVSGAVGLAALFAWRRRRG